MTRIKKGNSEFRLMLFPPFFWLSLFFIIPLIIIIVYSFSVRKMYGGVELSFTLEHFKAVFDPLYMNIFLRSFMYAFVTTVITLLLAYPIGFYMAFAKPTVKKIIMFLIILPLWTNLLVELYSLIILFGNSGLINSILLKLGFINEPIAMLNNSFSVYVGLVYWNLPYMILPIYASLDKMNISLYEASMDLGGNRLQSFKNVLLPVSMPGIIAGIVFCFIPTLGNFFVPDVLGGTDNYLIGNVITSQFLQARNWSFGSALSSVLIFIIFIFVFLYIKYYNPAEENNAREI
jgi:spermidine/putrescine transport system permease protein